MMRLNNYLTYKRVSGLSIFLMFAGLSIAPYSVQANPFATPSLTSDPYTCPVNHKMYYVGRDAPDYKNKTTQNLDWISGNDERDFTFNEPSSGNKVFNFKFTWNNNSGTVPFFGSNNSSNENTENAINFRHGRRVIENNTVSLKVNKPTSKIGYKIQDLDSEGGAASTFYTQKADVSLDGGSIALLYASDIMSFDTFYHIVNANRSIVTAKHQIGCALNECNIEASWKYKPANSSVKLVHSNDYNASLFPATHRVGYSDFYFCLAPPKIIVNKALNGSRIDDNDQFKIDIIPTNQPSSQSLGTFITTGNGSNVTTSPTNAVTLAIGANEVSPSYTITESVLGGGNISNYTASYTCSNATTGSTTVMPTAAMSYDATAKTRSFTLANATYGDEITCTITNTPKSYTFSGTVFNDNGGITNPDSQLVDGIYKNSNFFNGIFDTNEPHKEAGIDGMDTVKARLSDCSNNPSANPIIATVNVTSSGTYSFSVLPKELEGKTDLCIEEMEPNDWLYSVDTTPSIRKFSFDPSILNYQTGVEIKGSMLNLDFGNVIKENTALVLVKSQYVHDCSLTDLMAIGVNYDGLPTVAFSKQPIAGIEPGQCIAYRIEAINRGNVPLTAVIIKDTLQKTVEGNALATSTLVIPIPIGESSGTPTFPTNSVAIGSNGIVMTNSFTLANGPSNSKNRRKAIRFNTKYGSISDK